MSEREKWVQTSLYQRGPFRGMKKDEVDVYVPKREPVYWMELPWRISISRANILNQQEDTLTAAVGEEREIIVFEKRRGPYHDYHYRPIEDYWYPREGITLFPEQIKGLKILEGEELEKATVEEIGGKAKGLLRLKKLAGLGFRVPDFFVIPTSFYHRLNDAFSFEGRAEDVMATYTPDEITRGGWYLLFFEEGTH